MGTEKKAAVEFSDLPQIHIVTCIHITTMCILPLLVFNVTENSGTEISNSTNQSLYYKKLKVKKAPTQQSFYFNFF